MTSPQMTLFADKDRPKPPGLHLSVEGECLTIHKVFPKPNTKIPDHIRVKFAKNNRHANYKGMEDKPQQAIRIPFDVANALLLCGYKVASLDGYVINFGGGGTVALISKSDNKFVILNQQDVDKIRRLIQ